MARRVIAAIVIALLVVGVVVVNLADRSDAKFTIVSGPPDPVIPIVVPKTPTRYEVVATPITGPGRLFLQVGTYLEIPRDTVVLSVLDASGRRIARCVFPPSSYRDNEQLPCPLRDIAQARALIVTRRGNAKLALYGHGEKAGFLVRNEATSLGGRISTELSRVAVPLPNGLGSTVLLVGLFGSVALTVLVLLLAVRDPRRREDTAGGAEGSPWLYGDPYVRPRDTLHHAQHQHPGEQNHQEQGHDPGHQHTATDEGTSGGGHHSTTPDSSADDAGGGSESGGGGGDSGGADSRGGGGD